jgi:hypothetical protein
MPEVGHSAGPVYEPCDLVVEALDAARGDSVFEESGDGWKITQDSP